MDLMQGVRCGILIGGPDRHRDDDAAGGIPLPCLRKGQHIRALVGLQSATAIADKQLDRAVAFLDLNRMALAIVVGNAGGLARDVAAPKRQRDAKHQPGAHRGRTSSALAGDRKCSGCHRSSPAINPE